MRLPPVPSDPLSEIGERYGFDNDGKLVIRRTQDVADILQRNAEEADYMPSMYGTAAVRKVGSIPHVVAQEWSKECGASIGTKEFGEYVKRKLMDGDFAKLRVKGY